MGASASPGWAYGLTAGACTSSCAHTPGVCIFLCMHHLGSVHMPKLVFAPSGTHQPVGFHVFLWHDLEDVLAVDYARTFVRTTRLPTEAWCPWIHVRTTPGYARTRAYTNLVYARISISWPGFVGRSTSVSTTLYSLPHPHPHENYPVSGLFWTHSLLLSLHAKHNHLSACRNVFSAILNLSFILSSPVHWAPAVDPTVHWGSLVTVMRDRGGKQTEKRAVRGIMMQL